MLAPAAIRRGRLISRAPIRWRPGPRDLQDKELGALHQRLQPTPPISTGWAALGQLYLYRDEYENALLAYQRLALQEGGASAATQAAQATVLLLPGRASSSPRGRCACSIARSSRTRVR